MRSFLNFVVLRKNFFTKLCHNNMQHARFWEQWEITLTWKYLHVPPFSLGQLLGAIRGVSIFFERTWTQIHVLGTQLSVVSFRKKLRQSFLIYPFLLGCSSEVYRCLYEQFSFLSFFHETVLLFRFICCICLHNLHSHIVWSKSLLGVLYIAKI